MRDVEQSFFEITEACNAIVDSMDMLERTIVLHDVEDPEANCKIHCMTNNRTVQKKNNDEDGFVDVNTRDISFCELASPHKDPLAERTQNIAAVHLSDQKLPNRTEASQQKDRWIKKIRSECKQIYVCGRCQNDLDDQQNLIGCEGPCNRWFHAECAELTDIDYQQLLDDPASKWICPECGSTTPGTSIEVDLPPFLDDQDRILKAKWGQYTGKPLIDAIDRTYAEVVRWKRNLFMVPTGKVGEQFIDEVTKVIKLFNSGTEFEPVALTMLMVMFPLLLQKPSKSSKCKDHVRYLEKRLSMWKNGQLQALVSEARAIQDRLTKKKRSPEENDKAFTRLMLQEKISAALRFIGSQSSSVLPVTDKVLTSLKSKHPAPMKPQVDSVIKGPLPRSPCEEVIYENIDGGMIHECAKKTSGSAGPSGADAELLN